MARKLIALISTHGKTTEQVAKEGWAAFQKYQKKEKTSKKESKSPPVTLTRSIFTRIKDIFWVS